VMGVDVDAMGHGRRRGMQIGWTEVIDDHVA
jgi:hypothetical protein